MKAKRTRTASNHLLVLEVLPSEGDQSLQYVAVGRTHRSDRHGVRHIINIGLFTTSSWRFYKPKMATYLERDNGELLTVSVSL